MFCQLNLISKKVPNAKNAQKCKKLSNIEKIFLARFAHSDFTKFIFLEQLTVMPQFNMQNMLCFFFFVFFFVLFFFLFFFFSSSFF